MSFLPQGSREESGSSREASRFAAARSQTALEKCGSSKHAKKKCVWEEEEEEERERIAQGNSQERESRGSSVLRSPR